MANTQPSGQKQTQVSDFLLEIGTEELPAKTLQDLVASLAFNIETGLQTAELNYKGAFAYASARRLAVLINDLDFGQAEQLIERRGPSLSAAFNEDGSPTQACLGFANSCGVSVLELEKYKTTTGAWLLYRKKQSGKSVFELMPKIIDDALAGLPIKRPMHWGDGDVEFVRPVHWVVMLYGADVINAKVLGVDAGRLTYGHRFHHPEAISLTNASYYADTLYKTGFVIADFEERKEVIRNELAKLTVKRGTVIMDDDLLNETTGLVEWPIALLGSFDPKFLAMPLEILHAVMKNYQRCFCLLDDAGGLLPHFAAISNIESKEPERVVTGNERVMRARLRDSEFFYHTDLKSPLSNYVKNLQDVVYQDKLGTLYDKAIRLENLASYIAGKIGADVSKAKQAAHLAKADLVTQVVRELPELQGVMGYYYALEQGEQQEVALAIREHYLPRYSGDILPASEVGCAVALADRIDHLVGIFGVGEIPTGDKDPFGLRRAALGVIRLIIENQSSLDLVDLLDTARNNYPTEFKKTLNQQVLDFVFDRLRGWYLEQGVPANVFHAVLARQPTALFDFHRRIYAVRNFQELPEAVALIAAHKRVSNILKKSGFIGQLDFNADLLRENAERELAVDIAQAEKIIEPLYNEGFYTEALKVLAELKGAIDHFFDEVMVMVDDEALRNNRFILLGKMRNLFCYVADLALL